MDKILKTGDQIKTGDYLCLSKGDKIYFTERNLMGCCDTVKKGYPEIYRPVKKLQIRSKLK